MTEEALAQDCPNMHSSQTLLTTFHEASEVLQPFRLCIERLYRCVRMLGSALRHAANRYVLTAAELTSAVAVHHFAPDGVQIHRGIRTPHGIPEYVARHDVLQHPLPFCCLTAQGEFRLWGWCRRCICHCPSATARIAARPLKSYKAHISGCVERRLSPARGRNAGCIKARLELTAQHHLHCSPRPDGGSSVPADPLKT